MIVPTLLTATAGSAWLATDQNAKIRDALQFLLAPPAFSGYMAADVSQGSAASFGTDKALTELFDNDGMHSGTDNFITIQIQGRYNVDVWGTIEANSTGSRGVRCNLNGAQLTQCRNRASESGTWCGDSDIDVDLEVGDVLSLSFFQNSGGALLIVGGTGPINSGLSARWIGLGD